MKQTIPVHQIVIGGGKRKRGRLLILVLASALISTTVAIAAEGDELHWAIRAGGASSDRGYGIATDASGNTLVTGFFEGTATFGAGEPNETDLTSTGSEDIFVAKYDPNGALLWARSAGGSSDDEGRGIATDGSGNSVVTGKFEGTATFGEGDPNETELTSDGCVDVFVAKYDPNGVLLWTRRAGGTDPQYGDTDEGQGIATDGSGNSLVTGYFQGTATFGEGDPNETDLTSAGYVDVFVAKYDPDGVLLWARCDGGTDYDVGDGIATDGSGNSLVTGYFYETSTFGAGEIHETSLTSAGKADVFVAKYDPDGALLWAGSAGGTSWDRGGSIATDGSGSSLVTGVLDQAATFGTVETIQVSLTSRGNDDIFVAKYDPDGALLWARGAGGAGDDEGYGIATDGSGNSLVTGKFHGTATLGTGETNETSLVSNGDDDIFLAKYRPDGALLWARASGGTSDDEGRAIATDDNGNGLATGYFGGTATFGAGEPSETHLTSAGDADVFCSFTDAQRAALVIEKQARSGGVANTVAFEIPDLPPGAYPVTKSRLTPGVSLTAISCNDGDSSTPSTWDLVTGRATYGLDPGERVVCVFTNLLPFGVGGAAARAHRLALLAPWIGLAGAASLIASTAVVVRRHLRR